MTKRKKGKQKRLHACTDKMMTPRQKKKRGHHHYMSKLKQSKAKLQKLNARNKGKKYA